MAFTMDVVRGDVGKQLDDSQRRTLGERVEDTLGRIWSYVRFDDAVSTGQLVRDDIVTGSFTADSTRYLPDTGEFTGDKGKNLVGAFGSKTEQSATPEVFVVTDYIVGDDDRVVVQRLARGTSIESGEVSSVTSGHAYSLTVPGGARVAVAASLLIRGFVQQTVESGDVGKYGYVLQQGQGFAKLDVSGAANAPGGGLVPAAGGLVVGAPNSVAGLRATIAISLVDNNSDWTNDGLILVDARINNGVKSYSMASYRHPVDQNLDIR